MTDLYRYSNGTGDRIVLEVFPVLRHTPAGKWIDVYGVQKFVLDKSHKRYACETKEMALASFIARKQRQLRILRGQLKGAEAALAVAQNATPETLKDAEAYLVLEFE